MCITTHGLGSFCFARHYSRNRFLFLFLLVLRCFSSQRSLLIHYFTHVWILRLFGLSEFPHSDISGSMDICSSPKLFAAYHVLRRLLVPRYSPYALCSLTFFHCYNRLQCLTLPQLLLFGLIVFLLNTSLPSWYFTSIYFSMCFFLNIFILSYGVYGGLKWTWTIDLTLIRRAL